MLGRGNAGRSLQSKNPGKPAPRLLMLLGSLLEVWGSSNCMCNAQLRKGLGLGCERQAPPPMRFPPPLPAVLWAAGIGFGSPNLRRLQSRHLGLSSLSPWVDNGKK